MIAQNLFGQSNFKFKVNYVGKILGYCKLLTEEDTALDNIEDVGFHNKSNNSMVTCNFCCGLGRFQIRCMTVFKTSEFKSYPFLYDDTIKLARNDSSYETEYRKIKEINFDLILDGKIKLDDSKTKVLKFYGNRYTRFVSKGYEIIKYKISDKLMLRICGYEGYENYYTFVFKNKRLVYYDFGMEYP